MNKTSESQVLQDYFSVLITPAEELKALDNAASLLQNAQQQLLNEQVQAETSEIVNQESDQNLNVEQYLEENLIALKERLPVRFQALFFNLAGVTLALPLVELGGIHKLDKVTSLPRKPEYILGLMVKGEEKFQCIDTARWIMPEKYLSLKQEIPAYKFAVQLGKTGYVLACEAIEDTLEISQHDIKWRDNGKKQPWFAGTVKEKMCALVDAEELVKLLSNPSTSKALA
ncbi:chemotaxis protein CheW [Glaciecola sp. 1036]|uniref:chemotaxis protein CheW n=1 Tax=Alteromonadaceae TaxID=72275 RepID=UPI003D0639FA